MDYQNLKNALINAWDRTDRWEQKVSSLSQNERIKVMNLTNTSLNSKVVTFPHQNSLAKEGFECFREIERLQKLNPVMADRIHEEVHY